MIKIKAYYQFIFNLDLSKYKVTEEEGIKMITFDNEENYKEFLSNNQLEERKLSEDVKVVIFPKKDAVYGRCL